jgi:hypothetical protein
VFPDNDERCFLITIGGSSTALSGPAIGVCPRRAAAEGTPASRRDTGWNSVAWANRSVTKEIAGNKNRPPPTRSERRAASPMGQVRSPTPSSSPANWAQRHRIRGRRPRHRATHRRHRFRTSEYVDRLASTSDAATTSEAPRLSTVPDSRWRRALMTTATVPCVR